MSKNEVFVNLTADESENAVTEIESLCMTCYQQGVTRLLLTKIPFYKDVIISSFNCNHCGYQNNEVQSGNEISDKGVRYQLCVEDEIDLNRQVIKSDYTCVKIVELDLEIPALSQKGAITTVEGLINRVIAGLDQDQHKRRVQHPDDALKIDAVIEKLKSLKQLKEKFTIVFEDISGNTFIQNPRAPHTDPKCTCDRFSRSTDQDKQLSIYEPDKVERKPGDTILEDLTGEVMQFKTVCANCSSECETNMKMTNIPHFKEVVIMATVCEKCGNRTNEVKSGTGIEPLGIRIELSVQGRIDFSRDVLKSETCNVLLKDLDIEIGGAAISGRFTTVEGLLVAILEQLSGQSLMFGDSEQPQTKERMNAIFEKLQRILKGDEATLLILDDPAGNSYVQSICDSVDEDKSLRVVKYERTFEQNEQLGLNDMKVENYAE